MIVQSMPYPAGAYTYVSPGTGPIRLLGDYKQGKGGHSALTIDFDVIGYAPRQGDMMLLVNSLASTTDMDNDGYMKPGDYTGLHTRLRGNDSADAIMLCSYKFMGETPDTEIVVPGYDPSTTAGAVNGCVFLYWFRGVHAVDVIDVTTVTATGTNSNAPNPPSATPSTSGTWLVSAAAAAWTTGSVGTWAPAAGFDISKTEQHTDSDQTFKYKGQVDIKSDWTSGAVDPGALGSSGSSAAGWVAAMIALKSAP